MGESASFSVLDARPQGMAMVSPLLDEAIRGCEPRAGLQAVAVAALTIKAMAALNGADFAHLLVQKSREQFIETFSAGCQHL